MKFPVTGLDEVFIGIDERYKPDLFGLGVKFDLDLFMTGHDPAPGRTRTRAKTRNPA